MQITTARELRRPHDGSHQGYLRVMMGHLINVLSKEIDLGATFRSPRIDWWARFAPTGASEDLLRYWRTMVQTSVEAASGIVTVTVKTFSREDSVRVATAIQARCDIVANQ